MCLARVSLSKKGLSTEVHHCQKGGWMITDLPKCPLVCGVNNMYGVMVCRDIQRVYVGKGAM